MKYNLMQKNGNHSSLQGKYVRLQQKITSAIQNGRFYRFRAQKQQRLLQRLARYYNQLMRRGQWFVPAAVAGLTWGSPELGYGQAFTQVPFNPFGLLDVGLNSTPSFVDIDKDGDLDAFLGEYDGNIVYFQNIGSSTLAAFAASIINPFGLGDMGGGATSSFVDIDNDGDFDAFVGKVDGNIIYFENTGNSTSPAFAASITNPFGLSDVGYRFAPSFVDIDNDGDLDAFAGEAFGNIIYFENIGSSTSPAFAASSSNPFGLFDVGYFPIPSFVDIDDDGDLDAFVGERDGNIFYFQNTGNSTSPAFAAVSSNPFGLFDVGYFSAPSFVDIDKDEDLDAFLGEVNGNIVYFENTGSSTLPAFVKPYPFSLQDIGYFSAPSFVDIDLDGDLDAFVGERDGNITYFENTGSSRLPVFAASITNPFGLSDVGERSIPSFVDIDNDGDLDAFVGKNDGNIIYFENIGSSTLATFSASTTNPFGLSDVGDHSIPSFVDIDLDGDLDAFMGKNDGNIIYFENTGSSTLATFAAPITNSFGLSDVGFDSAPSFVDIDNDGDLDTFVGKNDGSITYFENTGSSTSAAFMLSTTTNPFGLSDVGLNSTPSFVDIDGDNLLEAIIGNFEGTLIYFQSDVLVPVELVYFKATPQDKAVQLLWQTASELNNEGFSIEHSTDAKAWKAIGLVAGNGTTLEMRNYRFLHQQPAAGINYYRLKQLDFDGAFEYSDIVVVYYELGNTKYELLVYPNPANGSFQVQLPVSKARLQLYNGQGNLVQEIIANTTNVQLPIAELSAGIYWLNVQAGEQVWVQRVVLK